MTVAPPAWLNKEFLERALRTNDPQLIVTSYEIDRATQAGDHYSSEMYRANLKTKENGDVSLVIKCQLRGDGQFTKLIEEYDVFTKEAATFIDLHTPMFKSLKGALDEKFQPFAAKCIYRSADPTAIVFEDLKRQGFRLTTVTHGLDLKHCLLVMRTIAQYHAASMVLRHQEPSRFVPYEEHKFDDNNGMKGFFASITKALRRHMENWPGYEKYLNVLTKLENSAIDTWLKALTRDDSGFNVLIHGDLWLNNLMFRYSQEDGVQDVRFVDFQLTYITSPAIDLMYFMNSSAAPEVLENYHVLIDEYYNTLCHTLTKLGHQDLQPTKATLYAELKARQLFGVLAGVSLRSFVLADRNHVPVVEDMMKSDDSFHVSDRYQEVMKIIFPLYEKWGWIKI